MFLAIQFLGCLLSIGEIDTARNVGRIGILTVLRFFICFLLHSVFHCKELDDAGRCDLILRLLSFLFAFEDSFGLVLG